MSWMVRDKILKGTLVIKIIISNLEDKRMGDEQSTPKPKHSVPKASSSGPGR